MTSVRGMKARSEPQHWHQSGGGKGYQEREALDAGFSVGQAVGVDAFDQVVAGGGDEDGGGGDWERSEFAGGLGHAHDEGIDVGDSHDGGQDVDAGSAEI